MFREKSFLEAEKAQKYMTMLGKHFARKVPVDMGEQEVRVNFPWGVGVMSVNQRQFYFFCEADTQESLDKVKRVIDDHIYLLKDIRGTVLCWEKA